ncbi:iron(III) transport system permease protein [Caldalkalibacillus uzonensis]|uniref:Iron(III) transport system permease protein n=1 Tax=Caldalkalibacillus uzonensis TaxID=353224 RepID=A0ABU0CW76_9BACI|nr:iron ABC transporter permease [Caldalkalibacillus uzonensis]MDQ0340589.1 iron(III) transport system permease protein [Caldalkalibacillus uzonensis]
MKPEIKRELIQPKPSKRKGSFLARIDYLSVVKWGISAFFIIFLIIPLLSIFIVSFTGVPINIFGSLVNPDIFATTIERLSNASFEHYLKLAGGGTYFSALMNSLALSLGVSVLVILMCLPIAYGFARTTMPFKKLFGALCIVPLIVPTFISAAGIILMFGQSGWVTSIYQSLGGDGVIFDVYSMTGIVLVQIFFFFPFALWPMVAAFKTSDISLEEASNNLGAKNWITMLFVTLPLALPGIISSVLLIFTVSFSDFGTPIIMAPPDLNLIVVEAYREIAGFFNWAGASILTVIMVLVAGLFFWLQRLVTKGRDYGTLSGKPKQQRLNDNKFVTTILTIYTAIVVLIPLLTLFTVFLQSIATTWGHGMFPNGYTLEHYARIFSRSSTNIWNSIVLASGALIVSVVVATFISYFVVRRNAVKLDFMASIPLIVPGIALGIALIQTFNTAPLQLTGTATLLIVAYAIRRMPYMIRSTMGTMMAIKKDIEEAAVNLGASPLLAAMTVVGPLMLPGIAAGSILVFVTVIKETSITVLLAPSDWAPMSLVVFQSLLRGDYYTASAMAILIIVVVLVLQAIASRISKQSLY